MHGSDIQTLFINTLCIKNGSPPISFLCSQIIANSRKRQWDIGTLQALGFLSKNLWSFKMFALSLLIMLFFFSPINQEWAATRGFNKARKIFHHHQDTVSKKRAILSDGSGLLYASPWGPGLSSCQDSSRSSLDFSGWRVFLLTVFLQTVLTCSFAE